MNKNNLIQSEFTNPLLDPLIPEQVFSNFLQDHPMDFNSSGPVDPTFPAGSILNSPPLDNFYKDPFLCDPEFCAPNDFSYYMKNNGLLAPNTNEGMFNNTEFDHSDAPHQFQPGVPPAKNTANSLVNSQEFGSLNLDKTDTKVERKYQRKNKNCTKGHWTEDEDRILWELVQSHKTNKWSGLARMMPLANRSGKQLRDRYNNHLRPGLKKEKWTEEEDVRLKEAHQILGNKWAEITKIIPDRSENDIKNRWNATKRKWVNLIKKSTSGPKPSSVWEEYVKSFTEARREAMVGPNDGPDTVDNQALGDGTANV